MLVLLKSDQDHGTTGACVASHVKLGLNNGFEGGFHFKIPVRGIAVVFVGKEQVAVLIVDVKNEVSVAGSAAGSNAVCGFTEKGGVEFRIFLGVEQEGTVLLSVRNVFCRNVFGANVGDGIALGLQAKARGKKEREQKQGYGSL